MRLLIVDDEAKTRSGLTRHLDWESLGIDFIQTASGAEEAFPLCRQMQPDILLSDIRMRGMDGIEMCRTLRESYPDMGIIFISGYSDKAYLKAAIELGAVYYVEKPIKTEELEKAVKRAVAVVKKNRQNKDSRDFLLQNASANKRRLFFRLLEKHEPQEQQRQELYTSGLLSQDTEAMRLCIFQMSHPVLAMGRFWELFDRALHMLYSGEAAAYRDFTDNRTMPVLLAGTKEALSPCGSLLTAYSRLAANPLADTQLFFSVGDLVEDPLLLYRSYRTALSGQQCLFFLGYGKTVFHPEAPVQMQLSHSYREKFLEAASRGDETAAAKALSGLQEDIVKNHRTLTEPLKNLYYELDKEISLQYHRLFQGAPGEETHHGSNFQILDTIRTAEEMHSYLLQRLQDLLTDSKKEEGNNNVVSCVIRSIHKYYGNKELSVRLLAEEVYLTPTYLSSLFKRKTGKTIGEYITAVRMEKAKELLRHKQYKLYHIAQLCGYEDPNYFAKIFKKQTGLAPSEFRERTL